LPAVSNKHGLQDIKSCARLVVYGVCVYLFPPLRIGQRCTEKMNSNIEIIEKRIIFYGLMKKRLRKTFFEK